MSVRLLSCVPLALGCGDTGPPLTRLTQAWAAETVSRARPTVNGTLVLSGLAADLCSVQEIPEWTDLAEGDLLPIETSFSNAIGSPSVAEIEGTDLATRVIVLAGIDIGGRKDAWMRLTVVSTEEGLQFDFNPLMSGEDGQQVARMEGFGQVSLLVSQDCSSTQAHVRGSALWVDTEGRRHEIKVPADTELGSDLSFDDGVPWLPVSGSIAWAARIEGQERSLVTEDASELLVDTDGKAKWPATIRGPQWQGSGLISISP